MRSYAPDRTLNQPMDGAPEVPSEIEKEPPPLEGEAMSVPLDYRPRRCADVLQLDMGDGLILYNHDSSLVHHLNPSAGILWQLCDGEANVGQLAREISEEYGLNRQDIEAQVAGVVAEFDALNLVEDVRDPARREGEDRE